MVKKNNTSEDRYLVPAVEQASRILFCLAEASSSHLSLIEICDQVGIHKSKAFSVLMTLQKYGLVQKNGGRSGYSLGPGLMTLSRKFLDDLSAPKLAGPILEALASKTDSMAALGMISDKDVFVVAKHERDIGITLRIGHRFPLTYGSHGKAIVAFMPEEERDRLLKEKKLYFHGDPASLNRERLKRELAQCRVDGFALDLGEMRPGLNTIAAPVMGHNGIPIGYIVVLGFFAPDAAQRFGKLVAESAEVLSEQLGARMDTR
ncbi:MAG: IclR family transcriptional regulator [Desulfobacteraceae bacterium]|nr:MAG: IclR family transcriptional regulator [Desulfobacteraceae bacterium]